MAVLYPWESWMDWTVTARSGCRSASRIRWSISRAVTKRSASVWEIRTTRGLDVLSALTLVTEVGDIRRFGHPRRLTSYAGMDLIEHSSGGKERKFSMSRMGNRHIRTAVIEACQYAFNAPVVSQILQKRRQETPAPLVEIAVRCMQRLHKKARRLLYRDKPRNKIKAACAREMLGFIWESLNAVAHA